ncbi:MAG TPA: hypothetical protein PKA06_14965 [Gemmatales bacterium]|nr:hypothetical protein [Gemmatales bacterium]
MEDVQRIKTECPESKIVLIGYSAGAESAAIITNRLHDQSGIDVDCLFYLSGVTLINSEFHHPDYVDRIINIRDAKLPLLGMRLDGAENYWLTDTFHYRSPTHPRTLEILQRELDLLRYAEGR